MAAGSTTRFPRWRVWRRVLTRTEADIATLWGAVLVPLAFGFVGAFVVLPKDADWGARFFDAIGVAVLATLGVWGLLLAAHALSYSARGHHDSVWRVDWALRSSVHPAGVARW